MSTILLASGGSSILVRQDLDRLVAQLPRPFLIMGDLQNPLWGSTDINVKGKILETYFKTIIFAYLMMDQGRKEGNVLFNDTLNTFYLRLYGVRHMVKYHTDSERGNPLPPDGLFFPINSKGSFISTIPQT